MDRTRENAVPARQAADLYSTTRSAKNNGNGKLLLSVTPLRSAASLVVFTCTRTDLRSITTATTRSRYISSAVTSGGGAELGTQNDIIVSLSPSVNHIVSHDGGRGCDGRTRNKNN
jgi:hypothetical protein